MDTLPDSYEPNELRHITDLEHFHKRPSMYFGDLGAATIPNCLAREAYCLAIDQIVAKNCTRVTTEFTDDGFASVSHNGTPLAVTIDPRLGDLSEMRAVAELMRFCAEYAASEYVHSSICKNGMTALNALCERFELHNYSGGTHYISTYNRGVYESLQAKMDASNQTGVTVKFKPDGNMVHYTAFDAIQLQQWFASLPIDTEGIEINWIDRRDSMKQ
jgi:DNA gyrase subunit B